MAARLSSDEAKRRVVHAARALAAESGMAGLTIDAVSARSGVAKTTIYRSWPTIEELRIETIGSLIAELPTPDTGSLQGDLETCAEMFDAHVVGGGMRPLMLSVLDAEARNDRLVNIRQNLMAANADPLAGSIRKAIDRGELPDDIDIELASDLVRGPLFIRLVIEGRPTTPEQRSSIIRAAITGMADLRPRQGGSDRP
ncbi:MAG: TetR/AcrR family transcriptional regulator [Actinomycetota bacterium]